MRAGAGRVTGWSPGEMRGQGHPECGEHEHPGDQYQPASEERAEDTRDHDDEHGDAAHEHDAPGLADPEARSDHGNTGQGQADPDDDARDAVPRAQHVGAGRGISRVAQRDRSQLAQRQYNQAGCL